MKTILISGLIAGGFAAIWGCLMCVGAVEVSMNLGMAIGYLTMLIGLSIVFFAIKRRRDVDQGGVIRFLPALGLGLAISVVAAIVYALMWEFTLSIIGIDAFGQKMVEMMQEGGATAKEVAEMRDFFTTSYANPLFRFFITLTEIGPVGLLVSLVSAALLRNPRFMPARTAEPA
ncbi:DUF4199 domain-containing protein [Sphingomonas sp. G-3-2-10]|uniref:DUF4199 domain-containing protein n=1 Tax=Sphingomonas sp. G-3-2-10 TaxID=2728838 RepID=UPI00146AB9DF|nr:DUF4199 domain-containing protein [Sphingomonas sp. G-3-2-10]NML06843.1 DUF4199 domain-containing protein [Sphingomonas sp. G-3-2-10]